MHEPDSFDKAVSTSQVPSAYENQTPRPVASAPFITYSNEPHPIEPLGDTGPLITWTVSDANGRALASGLDRSTAYLLSPAPALLDALREAIEYIPQRGRPVLLKQAQNAIAIAEGAVAVAENVK